MKKVSSFRLLIVFTVLILTQSALTISAEVSIPKLKARVNDLTNTLSPSQVAGMEAQLLSLEQEKGSQLVVLILDSTAPETIEQFGIRLAEAWKIGRAGVDDGAILIVAKQDRALRIEVGRGLEGAIPDVIAKRITEEQIKPHFQAGNFYSGINAGITAVSAAIRGEPLPAPQSINVDGLDSGIVFGLIGLSFASIMRGFGLSKKRAAILAACIVGVAIFLITFKFIIAALASIFVFIFSFFSDNKGYYRSGGGSYRSSGGFSGGFSGGGGSFGGGGASSRW